MDRGEEGAVGSVCENKQFPKDGFKDLCDKATEKVIAKVLIRQIHEVVLVMCFYESELLANECEGEAVISNGCFDGVSLADGVEGGN